jgi:hypothetical protein
MSGIPFLKSGFWIQLVSSNWSLLSPKKVAAVVAPGCFKLLDDSRESIVSFARIQLTACFLQKYSWTTKAPLPMRAELKSFTQSAIPKPIQS